MIEQKAAENILCLGKRKENHDNDNISKKQKQKEELNKV